MKWQTVHSLCKSSSYDFVRSCKESYLPQYHWQILLLLMNWWYIFKWCLLHVNVKFNRCQVYGLFTLMHFYLQETSVNILPAYYIGFTLNCKENIHVQYLPFHSLFFLIQSICTCWSIHVWVCGTCSKNVSMFTLSREHVLWVFLVSYKVIYKV